MSSIAWMPRHDQVIVRPFAASSRSAGGLHLPEQGRDKPQQGVVVAVGGYARLETASGGLEVDDVVAFGKFAGIPFDDPATGLELLVMREVECLLVRRDHPELIEHETPGGRKVLHPATDVCEHCPTPELDAERERFRLEKAAELER